MIKTSAKNKIKIDGNEFAIIKKELEDNKEVLEEAGYFKQAINRVDSALSNWLNGERRIALDLLKDLKYVCPSDFDFTKIDLVIAILKAKA